MHQIKISKALMNLNIVTIMRMLYRMNIKIKLINLTLIKLIRKINGIYFLTKFKTTKLKKSSLKKMIQNIFKQMQIKIARLNRLNQ